MEAKQKQSKFDKFLGVMERVGNKVPDPILLFIWLMIITILLSFVCSMLGVSAIHPVTGETITVFNLLSVDGFVKMLTTAQSNFTGVSALGMVLVCMMGVSMCEQSGLFHAALKGVVERSKGSQMKILIIFFICCVLADCTGGAGWVVLPPLGAIVWLSLGRNPLAGMFAAYATTASAFCANILITSMDLQNCGYSQSAIDLLDPSFTLSAACNWYFSALCAVALVPLSLFVTLRFVEPRLGKYDPANAEEGTIAPNVPVTDAEFKALKTAGFSFLVYIAVVVILVVTGVLSDPETGSFVSSSAPLMKSMSLLVALMFAIPGGVFGFKTGRFTCFSDISKALSTAMSSMGNYIAVIFFLGQFLKYFSWSNLGLILAVKGAEALSASGLPTIVILVLFILFMTIVNIPVGGAGTKYAIVAPIFIPMFMLMGYNPAVLQMAYRIGDACTNPITPAFAYFGMLLTLAQKYDKRAKFGTLFANMTPYCIASFICMTSLFVIWFLLGLPLGIGGEIHL